MSVFVAIFKLIVTCIFCVDVNTLPIDLSPRSIDETTYCSQSSDTTKNDHLNVQPLENVKVQELLKPVYKIKEQNEQSKVSDKQYRRYTYMYVLYEVGLSYRS